MAISVSNGNHQHQFINLNGFKGSGEQSRYVDEVTGILLGIEPREGTYTVNDRRTGLPVERPNSWTAHVKTPEGIMYWSWPTYRDAATGQVLPWSRFDASIDLGAVVAQQKVIHLSKDKNGFCHLELVETTVQMNPHPLPYAAPTAAAAAIPATFPWEIAQ